MLELMVMMVMVVMIMNMNMMMLVMVAIILIDINLLALPFGRQRPYFAFQSVVVVFVWALLTSLPGLVLVLVLVFACHSSPEFGGSQHTVAGFDAFVVAQHLARYPS